MPRRKILAHDLAIVAPVHQGAGQIADAFGAQELELVAGDVDAGNALAHLIVEAGVEELHLIDRRGTADVHAACQPALARSEEHTSELQSLMRISYAVFCLK